LELDASGANVPVVRLEPVNIQQIGDELAIAWNDGAESFLQLEMLRRACPCAACGGEPDVMGNFSSRDGGITYTDKSFQLLGFDLVGGYAVQPRWVDGHSSGIYSFTYLRRLGKASG
jgi:DUF971 family protein